MFSSQTSLVGLSLLSAVNAVQYGYNHVAVRPDSDVVAANFQDVDIELLSPYFLGGGQPGFSNGTHGPTSHEDMGKQPARFLNMANGARIDADALQSSSWRTLPLRTAT